MLFYLVLALTGVYSTLLFYFILGAGRLYRKSLLKASEQSPSITVVVPLRNEENTALSTLQSLAAQDYVGSWEVICVNDRSTDRTREILTDFCREHSHFKIVDVPQDAPKVTSPKKRALQEGFSQAAGEIFMTTDADCTPPPGWLTSMAKNFTPSIGIVQGPKKITGPNNLITRYQQIEVFGFVSIEAATFSMGKPMLASAPSLAYRKSLYEEVGGFSGMEHLVSGDDDMLVHKMVQNPNGKVRYNLDTEAFVSTPAVTGWKALIEQRARWASNGTQYQDKKFVILLITLFSFYLWLLISPLFAILNIIPWFTVLIPFGIKCLADGIFLLQTGIKFKQTRLLKDIWWAEILNIPVVVLSSVMGTFGWYKWK